MTTGKTKKKVAAAITVLFTFCFSQPSLGWNAYSETDEMTGKTERTARVASQNDVTLGWPYGKIGGMLYIRNHPRYGKDVYFSAGKGQILCRSRSCSVLVRFDNNPPIVFSGSNPSDGSSETVFINGFEKFTAALTKAKTTKVQVEFYHNGAQTFVFDTEGFNPEMVSPKKNPQSKK